MRHSHGARPAVRDLTKLTPYEESIWAMHQQGLSYRQIAEKIGSIQPRSISSTLKTIKDKNQAREWDALTKS